MRYIVHFIIFLLLFIITTNALAQQRIRVQNLHAYDLKTIRFGFILGVNQMDFSVKRDRKLPDPDPVLYFNSLPEWGFHIGIVSDLRLADNFNLRYVPTLSFGDRLLQYSVLKNDGTVGQYNKRIESTFLEFPLSLKFKSKRMTNTRAYLIGGPKYSIDLASLSKKKSEDDDIVKLKRDDFTMELGVGFDFYLEYFKFGIEIKMAYGLNDVIYREPNMFNDVVKKINSKIFYLTFTFE
jgi:hypothetical protein